MAAARIAAHAGVACIALAGLGGSLATAGTVHIRTTGLDDRPHLYVDVLDDRSEVDVTTAFSADGPPARVALDVPSAFDLDPERAPGSFVGDADVYAAAGGNGAAAVSFLHGELVAAPVDAATDGAAQACSPGRHDAVWDLDLSLLGQQVEMPIFISSSSTSPGGTRLEYCPPTLAAPPGGTAPVLPIICLSLRLPEIDPPTSHGAWIWKAAVTPLGPDQRTEVPSKQYELRAIVPIPHTLTLAGRYAADSHEALLSGRLTADGTPEAGVRVSFDALVRTITPHGIAYSDFDAGSTTTDANGRYRFHRTIRRTTGFVALVAAADGRCRGTSSAPAGCLSTTTSPTRSDTVTVSVPRG